MLDHHKFIHTVAMAIVSYKYGGTNKKIGYFFSFGFKMNASITFGLSMTIFPDRFFVIIPNIRISNSPKCLFNEFCAFIRRCLPNTFQKTMIIVEAYQVYAFKNDFRYVVLLSYAR